MMVAEHMRYGAMLRERGAYVLGEALTGEASIVRPGEQAARDRRPLRRDEGGRRRLLRRRLREAARRRSSWPPRCRQSPGALVEVLDIAEV